MDISADLIVELYARYQLLMYWLHLGAICAFLFALLGTILTVGGSLSENKLITIIGVSFLALFITAGITAFWADYQLNVVLKPEIARHVVPAGLDIAEKVGREVSEMWYILKDIIRK